MLVVVERVFLLLPLSHLRTQNGNLYQSQVGERKMQACQCLRSIGGSYTPGCKPMRLWIGHVRFFFLLCQIGAKDLSSYESEKRPIAVYELAGSLAIESKASYNCSRQRSEFLSLVVKWQFHEYPRLHFQGGEKAIVALQVVSLRLRIWLAFPLQPGLCSPHVM